MIENVSYDHSSEKTLVQAVHEAMRCRYGAIAAENKANPAARKNRSERFREKLRLDLVGAKTADQCRGAICELFGRAGNNRVLRNYWEDLLPLLTNEKQWQKSRDLALLALASYAGSKEKNTTSEND